MNFTKLFPIQTSVNVIDSYKLIFLSVSMSSKTIYNPKWNECWLTQTNIFVIKIHNIDIRIICQIINTTFNMPITNKITPYYYLYVNKILKSPYEMK